ncbi:MAG: DUF1583 domain-containing protein [Planctomycetaceae bacterium]
MNQIRQFFGCCFVCIVFVAMAAVSCASETAGTQSVAVEAVMGEDLIALNLAAVRRRAGQLPPQERFDFLVRHVLPSETHTGIRMRGLMTDSAPIPSQLSSEPLDVQRRQLAADSHQSRISAGGVVVSPVFDLLRTAKDLQRLEELARAVETFQPESEYQLRCRLVMLSMIALAIQQTEQAGQHMDEFVSRWKQAKGTSEAERWPETLLIWWNLEHRRLLAESEAMLFEMVEDQIRPGVHAGPEHWNRLITGLVGRVRHLRNQETQAAVHPYDTAPPIPHWHPVSHCDSWSRGSGIPAAVWQFHNGTVTNIVSHDTDFLMFEAPLTGDFTLECDCTCFGYRDIHPFVAGTWLAPVWNHSEFEIGGLGSKRPNGKFNPKLTAVDNWLRYRVEIRDNVCRRYINGRLVHEELLPERREPWVAIRTPQYGRGAVKNVRITGTPVIPENVSLTETEHSADDAAARGIPWPARWYPWFPDQPNARDFWSTQVQDGHTIIVGEQRPDLTGTHSEQLFHYHWPLVQDSVVSWEFFHQPGTHDVFPALGRQTWILHPEGVRRHWVTNGIWDATKLSPENVESVHPGRTPSTVPLRPGEWNVARLHISGDRVRIEVNDQIVGEDTIDAANDRCFGLFYWCDRSQAMVRNVKLTGSWPRELPGITEQPLRDRRVDAFDEQRALLQDKFEFDFTGSTDADLAAKFATVTGIASHPADIQLSSAGLTMSSTRLGPAAYGLVSPQLRVSGDYDITAEFSDLDLKVSDNGSTAIYLVSDLRDERNFLKSYGVYRGMVEHPDTPRRQQVQAEILEVSAGQSNYSFRYPAILKEACTAGRLRILRRGSKLTLLLAEYDSDNFRVIHSEEVSTLPLDPGSIQLRTSCYSSGKSESSVSVTWKNLRVNAEKIESIQRVPEPKPSGGFFRMPSLQPQTEDSPTPPELGE